MEPARAMSAQGLAPVTHCVPGFSLPRSWASDDNPGRLFLPEEGFCHFILTLGRP